MRTIRIVINMLSLLVGLLHETTRDDVNTMIYHKQSSISLSHLKCVHRQYDNCPKYIILEYKPSYSIVASKIKFHLYALFSTCFLHGLIREGRLMCNLCENEKLNCTIRSRKRLRMKKLTIGTFMNDTYWTSLEK